MDQSLQEMLGEWLESTSLDVHTSMPGIVQSYDDTAQTCSVQPAVRRLLDGEFEELPVMQGVPVMFPGAGGFAVVFPLVKGDMVWLHFSETDWAEYRSTGQLSRPRDVTRHALSYPCAYPMNRTALAGTGARIVAPSPVCVGNDIGAQFVVLEEKLMQRFNEHTHPTAGTGAPSPPTVPLTLGQIASTKLKAEI